jgi:hypothetical protein
MARGTTGLQLCPASLLVVHREEEPSWMKRKTLPVLASCTAERKSTPPV